MTTLRAEHPSTPAADLAPASLRPQSTLPRVGPATRTLMLDRIIPPPLRSHPYAWWISLGAILSCLAILFSLRTSNPRAYAEMCILQIAGLTAVPLVIRICRGLIVEWSNNAKKFIVGARTCKTDFDTWLDEELSAFDDSLTMPVAGMVLGGLALLGFSFNDYPIGLGSAASIFASFIVAASAFVAGVGLCTMGYGTRMIWRFGNAFHISVQSHRFGVLSTGDTLLHCSVLVALIWSAYSSSAVFGVMNSPL